MAQPVALGIDIGGTNTAFGLVTGRGQILRKGTMPTTGHATVNDYIRALASQLQPLIDDAGRDNLAGIGIGAANANYFTGEIPNAANLPWKGVIPLQKLVADALNTKVVINNDANAAAIGEMIYGAAKGMKDFVMITLGTGVGSGVVANGQLIYGHDGLAGEIGHIIAIREGRSCGCGRKGCLETYASATGIVRTATEWLANRQEASLLRTVAQPLTAGSIYQAAIQGDPLALELFEYTGNILGQTLADVAAITSPQAFIFFGGLAQAGPMLMQHVQRSMEANLLHIYKNKIALLQSELPDADAAILGASALVW